MTAKTPLAVAVRAAEDAYGRFDAYRDRHIVRRKVISLAQSGMTSNEIADATGLRPDTVRRIASGNIDTGQRPAQPAKPDLSEQRVAHINRTADHAIKLAARLRDDDPQIVWDTLANLDRHHLQEVTVVLLAGLPAGQPKRSIYAWVLGIGDGSVGRGLAQLITGDNQQ